ncbi:hypothetical protein Tco_0635751 [Tanacetum coccineum]
MHNTLDLWNDILMMAQLNPFRLLLFGNVLDREDMLRHWDVNDNLPVLLCPLWPKLVQETTKKISHARDRQKIYADKRRKPLEFSVEGRPVAYRLDVPEKLDGVHDTFHVSNLKKCLDDPTLQVPLDEIRVDDKLNFVEEPVEILEREFKKLKRSRIALVKVRWNSKRGPEFTWEREDQMKLKVCPIVNAPAGRLLGAYDLGVATPRELVHAGDKTSEDARSWYMISGDAKSWV